MNLNWDKIALFVGGVVFGSAGFKLLGSKDARKVYTHTAAAALRVKECALSTVTSLREHAGDILADAVQLNEDRIAAEEQYIEDACAEPCGETVCAEAAEA